MAQDPSSKILTMEALLDLRAAAAREGRAVVQCHGCFDIVHPGHIRHLRFARERGDVLLVSITADDGVNKGSGRPLFSADLRAENLAALDCVDWVFVNPEPTAEPLLERIRPDVYIKGREYESNDDPRFTAERAAVERHGGRVVFSSGDIVFSSTALVRSLESDLREFDGSAADPRLSPLRHLRANHDLGSHRLKSLIQSMSGRSVCVVGEAIIDAYIPCDRPTVASDAPCLSLRPTGRVCFDGGAAIIARHLAAMGARPTLITALPDDRDAQDLRDRLGAEGIEVISVRANAPLPEKQRFMVGAEKVMKVDLSRDLALDAEARESLVTHILDRALGASGVEATILADFGLGLLTRRTVARLCSALRDRHGVLAGDVSGLRSSLHEMKHADLLMPSESELRAAVGDFESSLNAVVWRLMESTEASAICTTMGEEGATLFQRRAVAFDGSDGWRSWLAAEHVPALAMHRGDPLGCGDAMLAISTLALGAGATAPQGVYLGAIAAAIHAERIGNQPVTAHDLLRRVDALERAHLVVKHRSPLGVGALTAS